MKDLSIEKIIENWIINSLGLDKYKYIMDNLTKTDVSIDNDFQRNFNSFYVVRRDANWRKVYYDYMEKNKNNKNITFSEIITYLYKKTGNIEASFSSKLLATINPNMPIWDQYILKNLNKELNGNTKEERLHNAIKLYDEIVEWFNVFLNEPTAKKYIAAFDKVITTYKMTDIKKIDYILWSIR